MMKRFLSLVLVAAMLAVFAVGCVNSDTTSTESAGSTTTASDDVSGETSENGNESETIKIGYLDTLTTTLAASLPWVDVGMNLAVKTVNESGGIDGKMIEVVKKDTGNDPTITTERMSELKDEGVVAIIGPSSDSLAPAAAQWCEQNKMVAMQFGTASTVANIEHATKYFFYPGFNAWQIAKTLALNTVDQLDASTFSFVGTDGAAPNDVQSFFLKEAQKINPDFESVGDYRVSTTNTEFSTVVSAINAAQPDMLVGGIAGPLFISFVEQAQLFDMFSTVDYYGWYTTDASNTQAFGDTYPIGSTHGVIALPFWFEDEKAKKFVADWYEVGEELGYEGIHPADLGYGAYKAIISLAEALKIADDFESDSIVDALLEVKVELPFGEDGYYRDFDRMFITTVWYGTTEWNEKHLTPIGTDLIELGEESYPSKEDFFAEAEARGIDLSERLGLSE